MQQQHNAPPTILVPNPKNPRVLVTQQAAQKIREELEAAAKAPPPTRLPQKQAYVAPPPKTGQSAKPKFSAPPVLLRRGSAPPPLAQTTDTTVPAQGPKAENVAAMPRPGPAVVPVLPATKNAEAAPPAARAQPRPATAVPEKTEPVPPKMPVAVAVSGAAKAAKPPAPAMAAAPQNQKTKKGPARQKSNSNPDESSVAIVPPARDDNVPGEVSVVPPKGSEAPFDEDLFEALLNA